MTRTLALTLLVTGLLLVASPALADHDYRYCHDTDTADADDTMTTDTGPPAICVADSGLPGGGVIGDADESGGQGAVPTRIDAGAGGAAATGNLLGIGAILTGATTAAAVVARRRRRG